MPTDKQEVNINVFFKIFGAKTIYVINKDNKVIEEQSTSVKTFVKDIEELSHKYTIKNVNHCGNKSYLTKFQKDLQEITKYNLGMKINIYS